ncbi:dapper homolog 2 [Sciurus carolinensis]|uniref:dapper homolog 2 n=1 Tax=Sciurus carolinensis TaxID=30640 RepID=UPI001FB47099|nr:dapper homolog 2 [Sciurus carolinensis]
MWAPGGPPEPAGWDRRRVGARLRAALAGLQELQGLRAAQQARVRGALAMQPAPAGSRRPGGQELRLEAALAALQEQLSRLRRQDTGLKTHLDQLDQQISELQLGVRRSSAEVLDSDSRPSSGFYELSDAGSCSLSTSCASVCSDRLSPSLGSLLPAVSMARPSMGDWRPRSADETTVPAWRPRPIKESDRLLDSMEDTGQPRGIFRPRPVSTGDLERVLPVNMGLPSVDQDATPPSQLCQGTDVPSPELDPKYQCHLVSRGGREVYLYPSPLHAVALQSPLFALTKETPQLDSHLPPRNPPLGPRGLSTTPAEPVLEAGPAGAYIDRLLRLPSREAPSAGVGGDQGPSGREASPSPRKPDAQRLVSGDGAGKLLCAPGRGGLGGAAQSRRSSGHSPGLRGPAPLPHAQSPRRPPELGPEPWNSRTYREDPVGPAPCPQAPQPHGDCSPCTSSPSGSVDCESPPKAPGHLVHPPCTGSEASRTGLKMGHPKPKPVKVRRKASDKTPRLGTQAPLPPERPGGVHPAPQLPPEYEPTHRPQEGGLRRRPVLAGGTPGRSCSESTLYPVPFFVPLLVAQRESYRASSHALSSTEAAQLCAATRRKQHRWLSTVEISAEAHPASGQEPSLGPQRPPARRAGGLQAQGRPTLARQDACARSQPDPSEPSAECASLLQVTTAESSEEAASDHTANRFGDGESSSSDSEGCFQSRSGRLGVGGAAARDGELARPWLALQQPPRAPAGARPPLPPVPKLCRIKASRALKKKIRRFQPAALKVMTMV